MLGGCTGLTCGDVLAVYEGGASSVMRHVAYGPPVGLRARLEADGTIKPMEPAGA